MRQTWLGLFLGLCLLSGSLTACKKGGAEKAGEHIDDAVEDVKDGAEDVGDKIEDKTDR